MKDWDILVQLIVVIRFAFSLMFPTEKKNQS